MGHCMPKRVLPEESLVRKKKGFQVNVCKQIEISTDSNRVTRAKIKDPGTTNIFKRLRVNNGSLSQLHLNQSGMHVSNSVDSRRGNFSDLTNALSTSRTQKELTNQDSNRKIGKRSNDSRHFEQRTNSDKSESHQKFGDTSNKGNPSQFKGQNSRLQEKLYCIQENNLSKLSRAFDKNKKSKGYPSPDFVINQKEKGSFNAVDSINSSISGPEGGHRFLTINNSGLRPENLAYSRNMKQRMFKEIGKIVTQDQFNTSSKQVSLFLDV